MHVHYAVPQRDLGVPRASEILAPRRLAVVTTLHGTDVTLVGKDPLLPRDTRFGIESPTR